MKIHSDLIGHNEIHNALRFASTTGEGLVMCDALVRVGSRTRNHAYQVKLSGDGSVNKRRVNAGANRWVDRTDLAYAASWSQWGWFLAHLYSVDPAMIVGSPGRPIYADAAHFHAQTGTAFDLDDEVAPRKSTQWARRGCNPVTAILIGYRDDSAPAPSLPERVAKLRSEIDALHAETANVGPFASNTVPVPQFI